MNFKKLIPSRERLVVEMVGFVDALYLIVIVGISPFASIWILNTLFSTDILIAPQTYVAMLLLQGAILLLIEYIKEK